MENIRRFDKRAFVSISMSIFISSLIITGIAIQTIEVAASAYKSLESIPSYMFLVAGFIKAFHVLSGICFAFLTVSHILANWRAIKKYFAKKTDYINKESITAFALISIVAVLSFLYVMLSE